MADESIHELTAAYALDALDESESEAYERHLAQCERCRDDLASMSGTAAALAYAVDAPEPPAELRAKILDGARGQRENVVPLRPRRAFRIVSAVAAVAACAAVAFGVWAATLQRSLDRERDARAAEARAAAILVDPASQRVPLAGHTGALYREASGAAALVVDALPAAPSDRTYEAWVIHGGVAHRAAIFRGGGRTIVPLERTVPRGSLVGVTIERAGGVSAPTSAPFIRAQL